MIPKLMLLPCRNLQKPLLVNMPDDMEEHEAYRYATGLVASVQEHDKQFNLDDIVEKLEEKGFEIVDFTMGPPLDCS